MSEPTAIESRPLGATHVQFFLAGVCLGTVRVEFAAVCKAAIEGAIRISDKGNAQEILTKPQIT